MTIRRTHQPASPRARAACARVAPALALWSVLLAVVPAAGQAAGAASSAPAADAAAPRPSIAPVDLNTAGEKELQSLPRIGPALAKRIVEQRKAMGGFKRVEDLVAVKGVGERMLAQLRPFVTVSAPAQGGASGARP